MPNVQLLTISYPSLISGDDTPLKAISKLLGTERLPRPQEMTNAIVPELYRNRVRSPISLENNAFPNH